MKLQYGINTHTLKWRQNLIRIRHQYLHFDYSVTFASMWTNVISMHLYILQNQAWNYD